MAGLSTKAKLTKRVLDDARHPDPSVASGSGFFIWDTEIRGFAVRVSTAGKKVFIIEWRLPGGGGVAAPKGRFTIGEFGNPYTVEQARTIARDVQDKARRGINPNSERQDSTRRTVELAFRKLADHFIETYAKRHQPRSYGQAKRTLERDVVPVFGSRPIHAITRADISALLQDRAAEAPQQARYMHATLRKFFRWAVDSGQIDRSPMEGMGPPAGAVARDRVLDDSELVEIWRALDDLGEPFASIYRLLMATGQRRDEVGGMARSEIDMATRTWTIPADRAKNGKAHIVPLNELAMATLEALDEAEWRGRDADVDFLFSSNGETAPSGWSKAKARLDEKIKERRMKKALEADQPVAKVKPLASWRVHDLRRTMATGLQRLGIRLEVTEAALNHVSGSRSGIVGVYQRHDWADEKRSAIEAWGAHLSALLDPQDRSNVVRMETKTGS